MIKKVVIKEFKVLHDIDVEVNGGNIMLLGDNEVGKSSFIQFIKIALGYGTIPVNAKGEGYIIKDNDGKEWVFKVKIKNGKSVVTIRTPEGLEDSKKTSLANIIGAISFDIDEFVRLSETTAGQKKQVEIFKSFLDPEVRNEIAKLESHILVKYNERTEANRDLKALEGEVKNHPLNVHHDLTIFKQVDVNELVKQKDIIRGQLNDEYTKNKNHNAGLRKEYEGSCDFIRIEIAHNNSMVDTCINNYNTASKIHANLKEFGYKGTEVLTWLEELKNNIPTKKDYVAPAEPAYINEMPSNEPIKVIDDKILKAGETNAQYQAAQTLIKKRAQVEELTQAVGEMGVVIDSSKEEIRNAIRDMITPVEGLSFDGDKLLYNGISVEKDSLSTSTIMELGVKLKIAENPDLGILFIEKGESLGKKRMEEILEMAKKNKFQVIMEQVVRGKESLEIEIIAQ